MCRLSVTLVLFGLLLAGCTSADTELTVGDLPSHFDASNLETEEEYGAYLAQVDAAMDEAIGEGEAARVADCAVINYGAKPCGGHWHSKAYSRTDGDVSLLFALGEHYTEVQREMNQRFGYISDCMMAPTPTPELVGGRCVIP